MADSIFKEVSFTPQSFDSNFVFAHSKRKERIISILENLVDSGTIVSISNQWKAEVNKFLQNFELEDKDELECLFKELDKRDRVSIYQDNNIDIKNENLYIKKIEDLSKIRAFDFSAGTKEVNNTTLPEKIPKEKYKNLGADIQEQTIDYMKKMLAPILSYAEIVKIYDPYFDLSEKRYFEVIEIICKNLSSHHDKQECARIEIHTSIAVITNKYKQVEWQKTELWQNKLRELKKKYNHIINIEIWKKDKKGWHERWLITNQCGISVGKGFDISEFTDSTWTLLNYDKLSKTENKFKKNNNIFFHICSINEKTIMRTPSRGDLVEKKRQEKLKNVKDLRKK